jgi:hypothetical protein
MTKKGILHQVLLGMDPYLSCGCPTPIWDLAVNLTFEVYGSKGMELLEKCHKVYDASLEWDKDNVLHSIDWEETPNDIVGPQELIQKLEKL